VHDSLSKFGLKPTSATIEFSPAAISLQLSPLSDSSTKRAVAAEPVLQLSPFAFPQVSSRSFSWFAMFKHVPVTFTPNKASCPAVIHFSVPCAVVVAVDVSVVVMLVVTVVDAVEVTVDVNVEVSE
jgi:hypothetical protein